MEHSVEIVLGLPGRQPPDAEPEAWHAIRRVEMDLIAYEAVDSTATALRLADVDLSTWSERVVATAVEAVSSYVQLATWSDASKSIKP